MRITAFGASDIGRQRAANEDAYCVEADIGLLAVADGVGGRSGGAVASHLAIQSLRDNVTNSLLLGLSSLPLDLLSEAMETANAAIHRRSRSHPEYLGMSTTLTACLFQDDIAYFAHVGDSRAYLLRQGRLAQLTEDHTLDNLRRLRGHKVREPHNSERGNQLLSALGISSWVAADLFNQAVLPGDLILLCSDGLVAEVNDDEICETLQFDLPVHARISRFLTMANERGGRDNITLVVATFI
jgi:serine/threonine protein phosphatase PrpC